MPFNLKSVLPGCPARPKRAENGTAPPPTGAGAMPAAGGGGGAAEAECPGDPYGDGSEVRIRLASETSTGPRRRSGRGGSRHSEADYEDGHGCLATVVVTLLILSPPLVLVGVVLLTTGAILSSAGVFGAGMGVIVSGVLMGALSAFAFVRLRSHRSSSSSSSSSFTAASSGRMASSLRHHSDADRRQSPHQPRQLTPRSASIIETTDQRTVEITFCTDAETTRDL